MTETITRGHKDHLEVRNRIAAILEPGETQLTENIALVRLTPPEYEQILKLKEGNRVAIINLQHYEIDPNFREFQRNKVQYGLCISKPGRNTKEERILPELDEHQFFIALRLDDYQTGLKPEFSPEKEELRVDSVILGNAVDVHGLLENKYRATMDPDLSNSHYYLRIYTIMKFLQPPSS